jgi:hypothetical protein
LTDQRRDLPWHDWLVRRVIHHEVVIRWDTQTDDESADVVPDSTLTDTWRRIVRENINLRSDAPTLQVAARSWADQ